MSQPRMISATAPTLAMNRFCAYLCVAFPDAAVQRVHGGLSMAFNWPHPGLILTLVGYFGLLS